MVFHTNMSRGVSVWSQLTHPAKGQQVPPDWFGGCGSVSIGFYGLLSRLGECVQMEFGRCYSQVDSKLVSVAYLYLVLLIYSICNNTCCGHGLPVLCMT